MADHPVIAQAKEAIREMVPGAVEKLGDLMESEHDGIRLAASKEILDRGGVPAKTDHSLHIDLTVDDEIDQLLRTLSRNKESEALKAELEIEDAIVIEDALEVTAGEAVLEGATGKLPGQYRPPEPEPVEEPEMQAFWQANQPPVTKADIPLPED